MKWTTTTREQSRQSRKKDDIYSRHKCSQYFLHPKHKTIDINSVRVCVCDTCINGECTKTNLSRKKTLKKLRNFSLAVIQIANDQKKKRRETNERAKLRDFIIECIQCNRIAVRSVSRFSLFVEWKTERRETVYHDGWRWHSLWRRLRALRSDWKVSILRTSERRHSPWDQVHKTVLTCRDSKIAIFIFSTFSHLYFLRKKCVKISSIHSTEMVSFATMHILFFAN